MEAMADIELRYLATMAAVVDAGSFGRAAARLGYTQSTVSQQVAALEKAVGGAVFDRPGGPRSVQITRLGQLVLGYARDLLATTQALTAAIDRFQAGEGRIDIGTFQSLSAVILPPVVRRLRDEHPGCDIRLFEEETDPPQVRDVDLMFHDGHIEGDVEHLKLLDDPYLLVAPRGSLPPGPVRLTRLHGAPMVAWPVICDQPRVEEAFARAGVQPKVVFRAAGNEAVLSMVRAGIGSAVMPSLAIHGAGVHQDEALSVHQLRPQLRPREVFLLWQRGRTHSPLAARAIEIAVDVAADFHLPGDQVQPPRSTRASTGELPCGRGPSVEKP